MSSSETVTVETLGNAGDGVARIGASKHYIPYAVPGDQYRLTTNSAGEVSAYHRLHDSPLAVDPACALFTTCGGCVTQRVALGDQLDWKTRRVHTALAVAGFSPEAPAKVSQSLPSSRRRVDLAIIKTEARVIIGLHQRKGAPVDMVTCKLLDARIFELLDPLRALVRSIGAISGCADLHINLFDSGLDLVFRSDGLPTASDRSKLAQFAMEHAIARISWQRGHGTPSKPEIVTQHRPVGHNLDGALIAPPPGVFMQATPEGEQAIIDAVCQFLPKLNKRDVITELYCGMGTLSFPLSRFGRVNAYEGHAGAVAALEAARAGRRITCTPRDLARQPLLEKDLAGSRVIVMDPPRAGAGHQAGRAAASGVKDIIYVSCSPGTLQKDLAVFARRGYALAGWSVIDQFLWSAEVESVVALTLDKKRLARKSPR